jgi:glycerol-3-phosphate cytidylyltransferase
MFIDKKELARKLNKPIDEVIVGFTASSFDLQESKQLCDYLIVGLLTDPTLDRPDTKNKPIQSIFERYIQVASCQYVDEVIPFESEKDLEDMIQTINPDIRICGEEYKNKEHTGKGLCHIHYNKRRHSFSTSELRERVSNGK